MTPSRPMGSSSPSQVQFVFALPGAHGHLSFLKHTELLPALESFVLFAWNTPTQEGDMDDTFLLSRTSLKCHLIKKALP